MANFNRGLGGKTGSFIPNKVGQWIGQDCVEPEFVHHMPWGECDPGLECKCKVIIETPEYEKLKCLCQLPGMNLL